MDLTLDGARRNYQSILDISGLKPEPITLLTSIQLSSEQLSIAKHLEVIFNKNNSDKASVHNYHLLYSLFINREKSRFDILEIGIGTTNLKIPSNMGRHGRAGASLKSWRDLGKQFFIVGADIDHEILFESENLRCFHLDQTDEASWNSFLAKVEKMKFDLIIDDGLHAPLSNLLTVKHLSSLLKPNGVLLVEDINEKSLPVWQLMMAVSDHRFNFNLIKTKSAYVMVIKNKKTEG